MLNRSTLFDEHSYGKAFDHGQGYDLYWEGSFALTNP